MWTNNGVELYLGDCQLGDRAATAEEIASWLAARDKVSRLTEIDNRLAEIDQLSSRPAREAVTALLAGKAVDSFTAAKIVSLEEEAAALRLERKSLT